MPKRYTVAELVLGVKADIKQLKAGLNEGFSEIKTFSNQVSKSTFSDMNRLGLALGALSGTAMAVGAHGVRVFADFEQAIANTASVTGGTTEEMKDLEKFARKMGKSTVFTATQAGDAMYYLASAGYNAREIMSSLDGILSLAAATQYDLSETTATVVSVLRAFSLDASQASRVANIFAASISSSQATMLKLQESMKYVSPVAANLNYSIESTVASLSLLYNSGLEASMAGTQLRMALTRLLKPTRQTQQAIAKMGMDYKDLNPAMNSIVDIIYSLADANAGAANKAKYMAQIFGVRAVNAMNILVRNGGSALEEMEQRITNTTKAAEMQQRQIDTLKGTWKLMTSAVQETSIIFGENLKPVIKAVMESVRQLNLWFDNMPKSMRSTIVITNSLIVVFTALSGIILLLVGQLPKIVKSVAILETVWKTFGSKLLGIVGIITTLAGALIWLTSMQEREKRKRKEMLLDYASYLNQREKDARMTINAANTIQKLSGNVKDNETKYQHLKHAISEINKINPNLIDEEKDITKQLGAVAKASNEASKELVKLVASKERLRKFRVAEELSQAYKDLEDFRNKIDNIGISDSFKQAFLEIKGQGLRTSKDVMDQFSSDMSKVDSTLAELTSKGVTTGAVIKTWMPDLVGVKDYLYDLAKTEEGQNKLLVIQNKLREVAWERTGDLREALDNAGAGEKAISSVINNQVGKKQSIVSVERELYNLVNNVFKTTTKIAEKEELIKTLKNEQNKSDKDAKATKDGTDEISNIERNAQIALQKELYEISIAGLTNRIEKRRKETDMWYKEHIAKLMNMNYSEEQAESALTDAYNRRKRNDAKKNAEEIAALELAVATKGNYDIVRYKIASLEQEKRKAMDEARALGQNTNKIAAKYEKEKFNILEKLAVQKQDALNSLINGKLSAQASMIEDYDKRMIAEENAKYKVESDSLKSSFEQRKQEVQKGLISMSDLTSWYNSKTEQLAHEHNKKLEDIQSESHIDQLSREKEHLENIRHALLVNKGASPRTFDVEQEKINYESSLKSLLKWREEQLKLVREGKEKESDIDKEYFLRKDALSKEHISKEAAINAEYESMEYERKLKRLEDDSAAYDTMLSQYANYVDNEIELTKYDNDEYKKLLELREEISDEMFQRMMKKHKMYTDLIAGNMKTIGEAIGKAGQGATDAWKEALRTMVEMAAEQALAWAKTNLLISIGNPVAMAKWSAAIIGISAAKEVALGRIQAAAYGGEVKRTGYAKVHQGEEIVPSSLSASIQRKNWDNYLKKAADSITSSSGRSSVQANKDLQDSSSRTMNVTLDMKINAEGAVFSPAGVDEQDSFYEKIIKPAEKRFKDAMQSTLKRAINND